MAGTKDPTQRRKKGGQARLVESLLVETPREGDTASKITRKSKKSRQRRGMGRKNRKKKKRRAAIESVPAARSGEFDKRRPDYLLGWPVLS